MLQGGGVPRNVKLPKFLAPSSLSQLIPKVDPFFPVDEVTGGKHGIADGDACDAEYDGDD